MNNRTNRTPVPDRLAADVEIRIGGGPAEFVRGPAKFVRVTGADDLEVLCKVARWIDDVVGLVPGTVLPGALRAVLHARRDATGWLTQQFDYPVRKDGVRVAMARIVVALNLNAPGD